MGALRQVERADPLPRRQGAGGEASPRKYDFLAASTGRRPDRRCFCQNAAFEKTPEYPELDLLARCAGYLLRAAATAGRDDRHRDNTALRQRAMQQLATIIGEFGGVPSAAGIALEHRVGRQDAGLYDPLPSAAQIRHDCWMSPRQGVASIATAASGAVSTR